MTYIFAREGAVSDPHEVSLKVTNLRTGKQWTDRVEVKDGVVTWLGTNVHGVCARYEIDPPPPKAIEALFELTPEQKAGRCSVGTLLP